MSAHMRVGALRRSVAGMFDTFVHVPPGSDFPLYNLPWGVFTHKSSTRPTIGVALGDNVINVRALCEAGLLTGRNGQALTQESLNAFMGLGKPAWREARHTLQRLLSASEGVLRDNSELRSRAVLPRSECEMQLPAQVGDYTDFYASKEHAFNCGALFRGPGHELPPSWLHLPIAYHGRSSSLVVSGTPVRRPLGQRLPPGSSSPEFGPCAALDFELEMGAFIGPGNALSEPITVANAWDHVFGLVLLNDWSARDIQKWEYQPLGPFLGKNFATQISPWVVTLDALEPFAVEAPKQEPEVLPYLRDHPTRVTHDIQLSVDIIPAGHSFAAPVTRSNLKYMYWTLPQMVAHHTCGGCNLRPGDLFGTGTISGPAPGSQGCLLEATMGGSQPLQLTAAGAAKQQQQQQQQGGEQHSSQEGQQGELNQSSQGGVPGMEVSRRYLEDGDTVVMRAVCEKNGLKLGFGECRGTVLPSIAQ